MPAPRTLLGLLVALAAAAPLAAQRAAPAAAGQDTPAQGEGEGDEPEIPVIQEDERNYIITVSEEDAQRPSLAEFVNLCQEATGRNFTFNEETQTELNRRKLFMYGTKEVPKDDFYRFFQIMMFINEFVCVDVGPPHISITLIQTLQGSSAQTGRGIRQKSEYVLPENLEDYIDQPATLITTVLHLPNVEVRQLTTSLRTMFTDTVTQGMIAASDHSVILQGFGSSIAALARILYLIDEEAGRVSTIDPVFDVIPLEFASAEDVADLIDQLLEARQSGASGGGRGRGEAQGVAGALAGGQGGEAKILTDLRTNSLLVMALPDDMPHIKELVAALDVEVVEPERNYHVYSLQNVAAVELAEVLDEFLQDASRIDASQGATGGRTQGGAGGGTTSSRQNEVVVVADEATNSLLIAAGKSRYEEVLDLVTKLDQRQDQVLIETALVALTGSNFRDIGVELAGADIMGDGGFGITSFGLSDIVDTDGDGIQDTRTPLLGNGVTAGILDGDNVNLPILLSAVDELDESNVLNVPSVLVNNNRTATVKTLDEQPTTTITATGGVGGQTQENFDGYEEAGITLTITPSISAANYLRLDLSLLVSTFAGAFQGAIPPPRITRELLTTINVPDGDTMVVGGIITDNATHTRRGVPWLDDVPLIGVLFRRDTNNVDRTTLYFFVTPHILQDHDFADLAEITYRKKLEASEVIGADKLRVVDPEFEVPEDDVDWDQFEVPLYRSPERGEISGESVGIDPIRRDELLRGEGEGEEVPVEGEPEEYEEVVEEGLRPAHEEPVAPEAAEDPEGTPPSGEDEPR